jgi:phenylacetate-CoA ligase
MRHGTGRRRALAGMLPLLGRVLGRNFSRPLLDMRRAEWLPPEDALSHSEERLATLLRHGAEHVPFYRGLGLDPASIRGIEDLKRFPVMGKPEYRAQLPEQFHAANVPAYRHLHRTTSGSTGQPFAFSIDREALPVIFASHLFYDSWCGLEPFDRYVRIVSPPVSAPGIEQAPAGFRLHQAFLSRLQKWYETRTQRKLMVWDVDGERALEIWREIEAFHPDFILGYTSSLALVAEELLARGVRLSRPLRGIITIAETLSPARRDSIERFFQAPVANRYGLREFGSWSAQSCSLDPTRFHINTELVVCEILREDGSPAAPGETGRVVLTDLWNYARPFIRYFTGDLAAAGGACSCGRGFPLLDRIEGRSQECLVTLSGKRISPVVIGHYLFVYQRHMDAVRDYQLVQESPVRACLKVVPAASWDQDARTRIERDLREITGGEMQVRVETVLEIPAEGSGKRPIIKKIEDFAQPAAREQQRARELIR